MAACDTFRAGAVEQLQQWADRANVDMYGPSEQEASPAAVLYGALDKAVNEKYDTLLVDTSGRLSNNDALTKELTKMKRVIQKRLSVEKDEEGKPVLNMDVPHESLLVLDAAQGRMALDSARVWNKEVGLSGLILTKLDGSARGGSVVAVSKELDLPVKLIGVGEGIEDLRDVSSFWLFFFLIFVFLNINHTHMYPKMSDDMCSFNPNPLWKDSWVLERQEENRQHLPRVRNWMIDSKFLERNERNGRQ